jgi:hypothetical protein
MRLSVKVTRGEETSTVKVSPLAFIGWEKASGRKMSDLAKGGLGMEDLAVLAMEQERLQGQEVPATMEEWVAQVDDLEPGTDEEGPTSGGEEA